MSAAAERQQFVLRIEQGQTRFPERPISGERFLIGAGSNCHLQLGGSIPILHSVVISRGDHLWIDAYVAEPSLLVNGHSVRETSLSVGDKLEIGEFTFSIGVIENDLDDHVEDSADDQRIDLTDLTAEELVDLLHAEVESVNQLTASRRAGANALMAAVQAAGEGSGNTETPCVESELEKRAQQIAEREKIVADQANHLQRAQERLEKFLLEAKDKVTTPQPEVRRTA